MRDVLNAMREISEAIFIKISKVIT